MFTFSFCLFAYFALVATAKEKKSIAHDKKSCCSTESFASLTSDKTFVNAHLDPLPLNFSATTGTWVTLKTSDGTDTKIFEVKSNKPTNNIIIMVHEFWGLNEYIQREAEQLQQSLPNVTVIAVDLYDGKVATDRETAGKYMSAVKKERCEAIIHAAIAHVGTNARIGTIGWCFGGGWSMQAALLAGKQASACVLYYGIPETDIAKLKTLHADVLGVFGKKDKWINPEVVAKFEKDMKQAGKKLTAKSYDADHAFANPSNPKFDKAATEDARKITLDFFKGRLK
ncbi:MAG: dienelactone hydrolase family protein [Ignavibacteriae bacterium]|nr:dienelactone hydrolase family protein [Ignavibacteriota bacterium]